MDDVDRRIVRCLERDGRLGWTQLGERVGLGATATRERVRALVERGVIMGFHARVDRGRLGYLVSAVIDVRLRSEEHRSTFEATLREFPSVDEAFHVTGRADYTLRASFPTPEELDSFIGTLKARGGVAATETRVILRSVL